jgi:hypothetical protein
MRLLMRLLRQPLIRLLAVNLAGGVAVAVLMLLGLLALNPGNLRGLILADRSPATALALLLFGFLITFGSAAMGTAIMAQGGRRPGGPPRGKLFFLPLPWWERVVRATRGPGERAALDARQGAPGRGAGAAAGSR